MGCPGWGGGPPAGGDWARGGGDPARGCSPLTGRLGVRLWRPLPAPPLEEGREKRPLGVVVKLPTAPRSKFIQILSRACTTTLFNLITSDVDSIGLPSDSTDFVQIEDIC